MVNGKNFAKQNFKPFNHSTFQPFGFLNVYKPVGMTSHDVVAILRRVTKIKQIGHTGTLDPFAQGVLPIAIGKATRLIEYLDDEKEYLAEISFGKSTNTYDCEGEAIFPAKEARKIALKDVQQGLKSFEGEILQTPPIYSAIKVKGKKLYEYARKGESVEIEPRKVFIEKIELQSFDEEESRAGLPSRRQKAEVLIKCSKGTYIRSIAHDLGQNLGCGAHLSRLIRTQAGKFFVKDTIALENIKTVEDVEKNIISPLEMLNLQQIEITEVEHEKVLMGQPILANSKWQIANGEERCEDVKMRRCVEEKKCHTSTPPRFLSSQDYSPLTTHHSHLTILVYNNNISAVAQVDGNLIKVKKVF